jgi:histidinol-phosphate aminotransferase
VTENHRAAGPSRRGLLALVRDEIRALDAYKVPPNPPAIVLDANESPWPLSEAARTRMGQAVAAIAFHRYPEIEARALRTALAARLKAAPEELVIGIGSDEVIGVLCTALGKPGAKVLLPDPTFSMYAASARVAGMTPVKVPLDARFRIDRAAMLAAIASERPSIAFFATPNNPTANAFDRRDLEVIVQAMPEGLVVIDEAYGAFSSAGDFGDWVDRFPNVGTMGTLSKIGLAALRIGWIRVRPELARELDKVRLPYDLPTPTQVLGTLALTELSAEIDAHVANVVRERSRLMRELGARPGVDVFASDANFVLIEHARASELHAGLEARGVRVRAFGAAHPRLGRHVRITVGTPAENDALLSALDAVL